VHPVGSYCTDISRCTVNKTLKIKQFHENKTILKVLFLWTDFLYLILTSVIRVVLTLYFNYGCVLRTNLARRLIWEEILC